MNSIDSFSYMIRRSIQFSKDHFVFSSIIVGIIGSIILLLATTKYGIGVSPDSTIYLDCARSISNFEGYQTFYGTYYRYAPFYPLVLSIFEFIGWDAMTGALIINMTSFILIIAIGAKIMNKVSARALLIPGLLIMVTSRHLFNISIMAWTEPLFICLCMASILFLIQYLESGKMKYLLFTSILASLAVSTRYLGIVLIMTGCVTLLFHGRKGENQKRFFDTVLFGVISSAPVTVFLIRNYIETSTLLGDRPGSSSSILDNLYYTLRSMTNWFIPQIASGPIEYIGIGIFAIFLIAILVLVLRSQFGSDERSKAIRPILYFFIIYVVYINLSAALVGFDNINDRFVSPIFIPFVIIMIHGMTIFINKGIPGIRSLDDGVKHVKKMKRRRGKILATGIILVAIVSFLTIGLVTTSLMSEGAGRYSTTEWQGSETIEELLTNNTELTVVSNDPWVINHLVGIDNVLLSPRKTYQRSDQSTDDINILSEKLLENGPYLIVWFDEVDRDYLYSIEELRGHFNITGLKYLNDGTIYQIY